MYFVFYPAHAIINILQYAAEPPDIHYVHLFEVMT